MEALTEMPFPIKGLDVAHEYGQQPELTTPVGHNVRVLCSLATRLRGGSRPGLSRYIDARVNGANVIQHLNIVVDPSVEALNGDDTTGDDGTSGGDSNPTGTDPNDWIDDPSTNNRRGRRTNVLRRNQGPRRVRRGGSGRQPNRSRSRPTLTITANNQTKTEGNTFTFAGDEFTVAGGEVGDTFTSATIASTGSAASAADGTYPIRISAVVGSVTSVYGQSAAQKYRIRYVRGTMTVEPVGIAFVQGTGQSFTDSASSRSVAYSSNVTAGNLLVVVCVTDQNSQSRATLPTDTLSNTWYKADGGSADNTDYGGFLKPRIQMFYAFANASGACTVTRTLSSADECGLAVLEYSGVSTTVDSFVGYPGLHAHAGNTSAHPGSVSPSSGTISISSTGTLLVAGIGNYNNTPVPTFTASGFNVRVNLDGVDGGSGVYTQSIRVIDKIGVDDDLAAAGTLSSTAAWSVEASVWNPNA